MRTFQRHFVEDTRGYPYDLQEWGKHAWDVAAASPIERGDVERATPSALAALGESFFQVRFDRLTPAEKKYLRAMAELDPGPHRSGDMAGCLGRDVSKFGPLRASLIAKGMIWSPAMATLHSPCRCLANSCAGSCRGTIGVEASRNA